MPVRLRHIAISSRDPETARDFFVNIMGWDVAGVVDSRNASGYYVTDGHINIAILNFKNQPAAGMEFDEDFSGLHHVGFQCDDINEIVDRFEEFGYPPRHDVNIAQGLGKNPEKDNAEYKMTGPHNIMVDVSERGWVGIDSYKALSKAT